VIIVLTIVWAQKIHADARRERYSRNRKKRAPGTRVHRKTGSCQYGMALIEELNKFFQTKLVSKPANRIRQSVAHSGQTVVKQ
jgi:hypothetical protein